MSEDDRHIVILAAPGSDVEAMERVVSDADLRPVVTDAHPNDLEPAGWLLVDDGDAEWLAGVDAELGERKDTCAPVVLVRDNKGREELRDALARPYVTGVMPRTCPDSRDELRAVLRRFADPGRAIFGLDDFLLDAAELHTIRVGKSTDRDTVVDRLDAFLGTQGVHRRIATAAQMVADEFVMNAVYNAPVDKDGTHLHRHTSRRELVTLPEDRAVEFQFACDGRRLGLAVRDAYGSLAADTVRSYLLRTLAGGDAQIEQKEGGAGMGMFFILESVTKLAITVEAGRATEFVAILGLGGGYRQFVSRPKSLHLFA
jgi:hypothetical protein